MTLSIDAKINSFLSMNKWKTTKKTTRKDRMSLNVQAFKKTQTNRASVKLWRRINRIATATHEPRRHYSKNWKWKMEKCKSSYRKWIHARGWPWQLQRKKWQRHVLNSLRQTHARIRAHTQTRGHTYVNALYFTHRWTCHQLNAITTVR